MISVFKQMAINIGKINLSLIIKKKSTIFSQWEMFQMVQMKEGKVIIYSNIIHCSVVI